MKTKFFSVRLALVFAILAALLSSACGGEPVNGEPVNQTPIISSLSSDLTSVAPGDSATITAIASDPDGDHLGYSWSATGGSISGTGEAITWTAPDAAVPYSISVTVTDGKGGIANKSYTMTVVAETANRPPLITSLSADLKTIAPLSSTTITSVATDPDGDPLTYSWWTELGRIEGTGNTVTWVAPPYLREYTIEVTVRDTKGGKAIKSLKVTVAPNEPPDITRVKAQPAILLLEQSTTITCTAKDPERNVLTYTWSATGGSLTGSGDVVTWTAPSRAGHYDIEVTVDDGRGGTDTSSVTVQAEGIKLTLPLKPVSSESGSIRADGHVLSLWTVGDDTVNNGVRTYLSFNIAKIIRVEEFRSAVLTINTLDKNGSPWTDLGGLSISEVDYGARRLKAVDYDLPTRQLESFDSPPITEIDLTPLIDRALRDDLLRFQITLYFQTETDEDSSADNIKVTLAELTVHYVKST